MRVRVFVPGQSVRNLQHSPSLQPLTLKQGFLYVSLTRRASSCDMAGISTVGGARRGHHFKHRPEDSQPFMTPCNRSSNMDTDLRYPIPPPLKQPPHVRWPQPKPHCSPAPNGNLPIVTVAQYGRWLQTTPPPPHTYCSLALRTWPGMQQQRASLLRCRRRCRQLLLLRLLLVLRLCRLLLLRLRRLLVLGLPGIQVRSVMQ